MIRLLNHKFIFIKVVITTVFILSIFPSLLLSKEDVSKISLDLSVLDKNSSFSENISDIFNISQPFIIPDTDLNKELNQDIDILNLFYTYKTELHRYPEYSEIKHYSLKLLRYYYERSILLPYSSNSSSSSSNLFIGIGSSPTPIISFIENLKTLDNSYYVLQNQLKTYIDFSEIINIPFSKNIIPEFSYYSLAQQQLPIYQERYLRLFRLFDLYTKDVDFKNKNIIIVDFAVSGISIALFTRIFLKYLAFKNITPNSINLHIITTLSSNNFLRRLNTLKNVVVENISKDYTVLSLKLYNSNYDKITKYPGYQGHYIKQDYSYEIKESPVYRRYSTKLQDNMKKDPDLIIRACPLIFSMLPIFKKE